MQTTTGINAFYRSLALSYDQVLILEGNLPRIRRVFLDQLSQSQLSPLLSSVEQPAASVVDTPRLFVVSSDPVLGSVPPAACASRDKKEATVRASLVSFTRWRVGLKMFSDVRRLDVMAPVIIPTISTLMTTSTRVIPDSSVRLTRLTR